jgi:hypothetical protein
MLCSVPGMRPIAHQLQDAFMEMLKKLSDYFPTSVYTGKCLLFVSEAWRVELTEHKSRDFSLGQSQPSTIRVKIFKKEEGEFVPSHSEDFRLPQIGELAEQIEKYVQFAIGKNIREII